MKRQYRFNMRLSAQQRMWIDEVKEEQRRLTDADAIDYLLWCYHNGWMTQGSSLDKKLKPQSK